MAADTDFKEKTVTEGDVLKWKSLNMHLDLLMPSKISSINLDRDFRFSTMWMIWLRIRFVVCSSQ
jgi:hypothetical protein